MGLTNSGIWVFFGVPAVFMIILAVAAKSGNRKGSLFKVVVGSDNRLSLSRVQAFAWTMVIVASWVAAMAVHFPLRSDHAGGVLTKAEEEAKALDRKALAEADLKLSRLKMKPVDQDLQRKATADQVAFERAVRADREAHTEATKQEVDRTKGEANKSAKALEDFKLALAAQIREAETALEVAQDKLRADWVQIPGELLALAGIAIVAGIFSSLLAADNSEAVSASVSNVETVRRSLVVKALERSLTDNRPIPQLIQVIKEELPTLAQAQTAQADAERALKTAQDAAQSARNALAANPKDASLIAGAKLLIDSVETAQSTFDSRTKELEMLVDERVCLLFSGVGLKKQGIVTLNGKFARIQFWSEDGTTVIVDSDSQTPAKFSIDTAAGKIIRKFSVAGNDIGLGENIEKIDFGDLLRDDKNPERFDLTKFQMFAWTIVAIGIYTFLFLKDLNPNMTTLPVVDQTIVILTGLTSGGYLAGKRVAAPGTAKP